MARSPEKPFLVWEPFSGERRDCSYAMLARDVEALAGSLHEHGIRNVERVLLQMDNSPEFVIAWFACARLGAVAMRANLRRAPTIPAHLRFETLLDSGVRARR